MIRYIIIISTVLTIGCGTKKNKGTSRVEQLPYYEEATFTPRWFASEEQVPTGFHQIPAFSLTDQSGQVITEKDMEGKITVVNFFFTSCPGICPKMTSNMLTVQEAFLHDEKINILSYSVTPEYDSVAILKEYAKMRGIASQRWHLLTGSRDVIYDLGRNQYFVEEDLGLKKNLNDFLHTENFVLIDQNRHIRGIYNGLNKTAVNQLIADMHTLKKERNKNM